MKLFKQILCLSFLSFLIGSQDCGLVIEDVREFNGVQKNAKDKNTQISKEKYLDIMDEYNELLGYIDNSNCSLFSQDSIKINLKFSYGTFIVKRVGDITSYKKLLTSSMLTIKETIKKNLQLFAKKSYSAKNTTPPNYLSHLNPKEDMEKAIELMKLFDNYYDQLDSEVENLNKLFNDLNIYISDHQYNEMQQLFDKDTNKALFINIEPPPIYYKKEKYKNNYEDQIIRMDFLRQEMIPFKLTSYDENKGFYMKVPMVPLVQKSRKNEVNPEYTYAVNINGHKKYRIQFSKIKTEDIYLSTDEINATAKSDVPYNWSKISLSNEFSWSYKNMTSGTKIATYNAQEGVRIVSGFEDEFIAVNNDNEFIIYQRKNAENSKYSLILDKQEKNFPYWVKYLLFITLFGAGYGQS